jgi:hypothetical protein
VPFPEPLRSILIPICWMYIYIYIYIYIYRLQIKRGFNKKIAFSILRVTLATFAGTYWMFSIHLSCKGSLKFKNRSKFGGLKLGLKGEGAVKLSSAEWLQCHLLELGVFVQEESQLQTCQVFWCRKHISEYFCNLLLLQLSTVIIFSPGFCLWQFVKPAGVGCFHCIGSIFSYGV